jgi:4-diphosphocytidyl-2-C-methyl-D-erythritol kinase
MADRATVSAPAKVNLRLRVLAREESGFHGLETVFCALSLADELEVRRSGAPGIELRVEGDVDTGPPERNLAVRAAERFYGALGRSPAVEVRLRKRIPSAAGLGGGSSDAAAALRALNALEGESFAPGDLLSFGAELGSDVPFFLCGSPLALGWSRGERLLALPPLPARPVLVAHPGAAMPTPEAFRRLAEARAGFRASGAAFGLSDLTSWEGVAGVAVNDFEPVVAAGLPVLEDALASMRGAGAEVALLAGSGAAVFGVFRSAADRDRAREGVAGLGIAVWAAETLQHVPAPRVDPSEDGG